MAETRKRTELGMGAVRNDRGRPSRVAAVPTGATAPAPVQDERDEERRAFGVRDTMPAPPMDSAGPAPMSAVPSAPPSEGRYSSVPVRADAPSPPRDQASPSSAARKRAQRSSRRPLRVDDVGATSVVAPHDAALSSKPKLVDRQRVVGSPLDVRDAFVLSLLDGALTVQDLVDATGIPEPDVSAILARLTRLGIVSLSG